jgi:hypothetical protein
VIGGRPMRYAGDIALTGLMGAGGAMLADGLAHSPMDRMAQDAKDLNSTLSAAPPEVGQAYVNVFGRGPMSSMDRIVATGILNGSVPPAQGGGQVQADSPAGAEAIELAAMIREARPELSNALAAIAAQENSLFAKEALAGVSPAEVMGAVEQGAGVSPVPALLGGAAIGGGTAALAALARRRGGGDPFQVRRAG